MDLRTRFNYNIKQIKQGLKQKALIRTLGFYVLMCSFSPSFEDFLDYFYNFGAAKDSIKDIALFSGILVWTVFYEARLTNAQMS